MARPYSENPRGIVFKLRMTQKEYEELYQFSDRLKQSKSRTIRKALTKYYSENKPTDISDDQPMLPGLECFRVERNSSGKIVNTIPITYDEYLKLQKEE